MHSRRRYIDELIQHGYTLFPSSGTLSVLYDVALRIWQRICDERSQAFLEAHSLQLYVGELDPGLEPEVDDGYLPRVGRIREDGKPYDGKHTWHYRPRTLPHLHEMGAMNDPLVRDLVLICGRIWRLHHAILMRFADALDHHPDLSHYNFADALELTAWMMPVRLINYVGDSPVDGVVGRSHQDRCSFTFHGYQKGGEIQGLVGDEWIRLPSVNGHIRVFGGMLAAEETGGTFHRDQRRVTGGLIKALEHRGVSGGGQRSACVSFALHKARRVL